jgi:hypothetical protein
MEEYRGSKEAAMVRTGRDLGVFGGLLALFIGFLFLTMGPGLVKGEESTALQRAYAGEEAGSVSDNKTAIVVIMGAMCSAGGALGFIGSALAYKEPKAAGILMVIGGVYAGFTVIGATATAALAAGGMREFDFAKAAPGAEPEWQDAETLPC